MKNADIIDKLMIFGNETAGYTRVIQQFLKNQNNKPVRFVKKVKENAFEIDINGKNAYIEFFPDVNCSFKEGDEIIMEKLILIFDEISHLVEIK